MESERIIKKYPNRRLYDTAISKYVTLEDICRLVKEGTKFRVLDAKSGEDLTRSILLQIILEQEEKGQPILTTDVLEEIIRAYGDAMQGFMSRYLEESMGFFLQQQKAMQEQMADLVRKAPMSVFAEMAQRNLSLWQSMQESLLESYGANSKDEEKD